MNRKFTLAWVAIFALIIAVEGIALVNRDDGDTLSEHVWAVLDLSPALALPLGAFFLWLFLHFVWRK